MKAKHIWFGASRALRQEFAAQAGISPDAADRPRWKKDLTLEERNKLASLFSELRKNGDLPVGKLNGWGMSRSHWNKIKP